MEDLMNLADKQCVPSRIGDRPLDRAKAEAMLDQLAENWKLNANGHLEKLYKFKDFSLALAFVNKIGAVAEAEVHHPDIYLAWGKCRVEIWTHSLKGLTESDFYLAAKLDREYNRQQNSND
jgi:4a-hydroxytetrahydrobiopterin dehydratase